MDEDFEAGISTGCGEGDLRGAERDAGGKQFIAAVRLRALGNDVVAALDGAGRSGPAGASPAWVEPATGSAVCAEASAARQA
jgi:hypothetical protein